jgi:Zn-dependent protease with chaperone function
LAVALVASAVFGLAAPRLSRALPPATATWLMSVGGLLAAGTSSTALALLGFRGLARTAPLTARGHWSDAVLAQHDPVSVPVAAVALVALGVALTAGTCCLLRRARGTVAAYRLAREVGGGELAVLDTAELSALAVPGRPGRIVLTSGMLRSLDAEQRRALLAHERAHLQRHHHLHQSATAISAALNPLLRPLRAAVGLSCERWADEVAATVISRRAVAQTLVRAAVGAPPTLPNTVLAAAAADVVSRVAALDGPAPRLRIGRASLLIGVLATAAVAVGYGMHDTEHLFELAQAAWRARHH